MNKIEFFKESIEQYEELLMELENQNAPIDAIELVKESIRTNKILLENCISKEGATKALEVAKARASKEDLGLTVGIYKNFKAFCILTPVNSFDFSSSICFKSNKTRSVLSSTFSIFSISTKPEVSKHV